MNIQEFLNKKEETFWETREEDLKELAERYDNIYTNEFSQIEREWKKDFYEWVTMDPDYESFSDEEKDEIKEELHMKELYVIDKVTALL